MVYPDLKKWTSLFIVFIFLANQCLPLYAAPKQTSPKKGSSQTAQKKPASLTDKSKDILEQKVSTAQPKSDEWYVEDAKKAVNQTCMKINDPHNVHRKNVGKCIAPLKKFENDALAWNKKLLNSTTCVGGEKGGPIYCYPTVALARGIIRSVLQKKPNENKFMLFETSKELSDFTKLIYLYGIQSEEDLRLAVKFCTDVISFYGSSCDGSGKGAESRCNAQISAVLAVSALNFDKKEYGEYRKSAQDSIYSFLKRNYKGRGGAPMKVAIIALAAINTDGSWKHIEKFLTEDSHPGILSETLDVLTPITLVTNAAAKTKAIEKWGSTSYRNKTVDQFMYVDWQENERQGRKEKGQYPYGNMLEDVGRFIGEKAAVNPEARRVAQKIMDHANGWAKHRRKGKGVVRYMDATLHWPVVIGILDGYSKHGKSFIYVPSPELLSILYEGDFWDLNEGTQQRVHYKAWLFAKQRGWGWKQPQLDNDKIIRSNQTAKAIKWAQIADIATVVVSLGVGLLSKIPAVSRGMVKAVSYLNATKARMFKPMNFARKAPGQITQTVVEEERVGATVQQGGKQAVAQRAEKGAAQTHMGSRGSSAPKQQITLRGQKVEVKSEPVRKSPSRTKSTGKKRGSRTGNNTERTENNVTGPLDQKVQQAAAQSPEATKPAAERLANPKSAKPDTSPSMPGQVDPEKASVMQRFREDISETFRRWWAKEIEESRQVGIIPKRPELPGKKLFDTWKQVRAERKVNPSNFIKAEPLDASHHMAYFVGEDGKVAKQVISNDRYRKIVETASEADTRAWASRQFKYKSQIDELKGPEVEAVGKPGTGDPKDPAREAAPQQAPKAAAKGGKYENRTITGSGTLNESGMEFFFKDANGKYIGEVFTPQELEELLGSNGARIRGLSGREVRQFFRDIRDLDPEVDALLKAEQELKSARKALAQTEYNASTRGWKGAAVNQEPGVVRAKQAVKEAEQNYRNALRGQKSSTGTSTSGTSTARGTQDAAPTGKQPPRTQTAGNADKIVNERKAVHQAMREKHLDAEKDITIHEGTVYTQGDKINRAEVALKNRQAELEALEKDLELQKANLPEWKRLITEAENEVKKAKDAYEQLINGSSFDAHVKAQQMHLAAESKASTELERAELALKNRQDEYVKLLHDAALQKQDGKKWQKLVDQAKQSWEKAKAEARAAKKAEEARVAKAKAAEEAAKKAQAAKEAAKKVARERWEHHNEIYQQHWAQEKAAESTLSEVERAQMSVKFRTEEYEAILKDTEWKKADPAGWERAVQDAKSQVQIKQNWLTSAQETEAAQTAARKAARRKAYQEEQAAKEAAAQKEGALLAERKKIHTDLHEKNLQAEKSSGLSDVERAELSAKNRAAELEAIEKDALLKEKDPKAWTEARSKALKEKDAASRRYESTKAEVERQAAQAKFNAEIKPQIEKSMQELQKIDNQLRPQVSQGKNSASLVRETITDAKMVEKANALEAQLNAAQTKLDNLYKGLNDAKWAENTNAATELLAQVPEASKTLDAARKAAASLRHMEAVAHGTKLTNLSTSASAALSEARATLRAAKSAGVPKKELTLLEKAVKNIESSINRANKAAKTAKGVAADDQIAVSGAIDEAFAASRQLEIDLKQLGVENAAVKSYTVKGTAPVTKTSAKSTQPVQEKPISPEGQSQPLAKLSKELQEFVTNSDGQGSADYVLSKIRELKEFNASTQYAQMDHGQLFYALETIENDINELKSLAAAKEEAALMSKARSAGEDIEQVINMLGKKSELIEDMARNAGSMDAASAELVSQMDNVKKQLVYLRSIL